MICKLEYTCTRRSDSGVRQSQRAGQKIRRKSGEGERTNTIPLLSPPTPPLAIFPAHIFLRHPHNLNAVQRINLCPL